MHPLSVSPNEGERGRASLEFLVFSVLLFLPVVYFGLSLASLQGASIATETAARNAVRVFTHSVPTEQVRAQAEAAVMIALANHGFTEVALVEWDCSDSRCASPGTRVTIRVGVMAPVFSTDILPGEWGEPSRLVISQATGVVSSYGGQG